MASSENRAPDIVIRVKGRDVITVRGQDLRVDGIDIYADLVNLTRVVRIVSEVLDETFAGLMARQEAKDVH